MRSQGRFSSRASLKQQRHAGDQAQTMPSRPDVYYMGIGKNGSSKRSINLGSFPRFSKKTARTPVNLRKWGLAEAYSTTPPMKAASVETSRQDTAQKAGSKEPPNPAALVIPVKGKLDVNDRPFACSLASPAVYFLAAGFFAAAFLAAGFFAAAFLAAGFFAAAIFAAGFFAAAFLAGAASSGAL